MPRLDMAFAPFGARPRLGISVSTDQEGTVDAQGARVTSVLDDGPAAEAGLQEGDIITRVGGQSLLQPLDADVEEDFDLDVSLPVQRLLSIARGLEAGEQVEIEYLRGGERLTATVEAQELSARSFAYAYGFDPERIRVDAERLREQARAMAESARAWEFQWRGPDAPRPPGAPEVGFFGGGGLIGPLGSSRYGLELIELNEGLGTYFGASEGVLVTEVDEDSTLGLRAGDVILRVGDRDVDTPDRMLRLLGTYEDGEEVTFRIRRNGSEMSVMGRLGR
jgi:S1-C subfamily serine protease